MSAAAAAAAPSGVVTFLFTDVEGSTRRWEPDADAMRASLAKHDAVLRTAIEAHGGLPVQAHRRRLVCRIRLTKGAVDAAVAAQRELKSGLDTFASRADPCLPGG